jgi:hypothetical protein
MLSLAGCNQVFGLDPPSEHAAIDAPTTSDATTGDDGAVNDAAADDAATSDAQLIDAQLVDARPIDAAVDAPLASCGTRGQPCVSGGYCNGAGTCVACTTDTHCGSPQPQQCTMPVCVNDACTTGPAPRDTFCNNWNDQCDGAGNCVDCTNSGGCGECCVCLNQMCVPA